MEYRYIEDIYFNSIIKSLSIQAIIIYFYTQNMTISSVINKHNIIVFRVQIGELLHTVQNVNLFASKHIQDREAASGAKAGVAEVNDAVSSKVLRSHFINTATIESK